MTDAQRPRTTYQEQRKDPRWQKKRLQVLEARRRHLVATRRAKRVRWLWLPYAHERTTHE
jgi:hypothetical protein